MPKIQQLFSALYALSLPLDGGSTVGERSPQVTQADPHNTSASSMAGDGMSSLLTLPTWHALLTAP